MARRKSFDWFVPALGLAIILALVLPEPGGKHGPLHAEILNKVGVALIFFLHGANLSFGALKAGAMRWQLHTVVQVCVFVLFPFMGLGLWYVLGGRIPEDLRIGFMFLCALPSTVSSSVALTGIAHGNVAGAIFNATISSIIGIFVTPLWMAGVLHTQGQSLNLGDVILDLIIWLLVPLIIGQVLRPWIGQFVHRHKKVLSLTDRLVILFLVYSSFCDSVLSGVWKGKGPDLIGLALGGGIVMFVLALIVTNFISRALKFSEEDRIAAVFCGSKKSLAAGVPMANILFAGHPGLGLILLPTILYHASQLIICSWLARRWAHRPGIDHSQSH